MVIAKETVLLPYPAEQVWRVVTDLVDTGWRSDLDHVEILSDNRFAEHTKSGHVTVFATMVQDAPIAGPSPWTTPPFSAIGRAGSPPRGRPPS